MVPTVKAVFDVQRAFPIVGYSVFSLILAGLINQFVGLNFKYRVLARFIAIPTFLFALFQVINPSIAVVSFLFALLLANKRTSNQVLHSSNILKAIPGTLMISFLGAGAISLALRVLYYFKAISADVFGLYLMNCFLVMFFADVAIVLMLKIATSLMRRVRQSRAQ